MSSPNDSNEKTGATEGVESFDEQKFRDEFKIVFGEAGKAEKESAELGPLLLAQFLIKQLKKEPQKGHWWQHGVHPAVKHLRKIFTHGNNIFDLAMTFFGREEKLQETIDMLRSGTCDSTSSCDASHGEDATREVMITVLSPRDKKG